jgi:hypothetical protein
LNYFSPNSVKIPFFVAEIRMCILVLPKGIIALALSPFPELANKRGPNYGRSIEI